MYRVLELNPQLEPFAGHIEHRMHLYHTTKNRLLSGAAKTLNDFANAHHFYGSRKEDVEKILSSGKHVLTVMDICGAMSLKTHFPNVVTIYVKRDKKELVMDILSKDCTNEDKANRLLAIDAEEKNAQVCDYTVNFESAQKAAEQIIQRLCI